jgi:hypothetical protein
MTDKKSRIGGRLLPALFILFSGCGFFPDEVRELPVLTETLELTETPFYPQEKFQCGPAALTTALVHSGVDVSLQQIEDKVYIPGREGSLQIELLVATRTSGRIPYVVDGTLSALVEELRLGRPVLVLQNLGVAWLPRWHYAAVVGVDPIRDQIILRSGTDARRTTKIRTFLHTWKRSDYWGMVVVRPGELPANADKQRFSAAIAAYEQIANRSGAIAAWQSAVHAWPGAAVPLFGLANAYYANGDFKRAAAHYTELLAAKPSYHFARNNLAMTLAQQKRFDSALQQIDMALSLAPAPAERELLNATRNEILELIENSGDPS